MTDLEMLKNPQEWPRWPVMPVVRLDVPGETYMQTDKWCGLVFGNGKPVVFVGVNVWSLGERLGKTYGEKLNGFEVKEYPDFEALLKEWRLD